MIFKEIASFYKFFLKTPKDKKAVVFYSEHDGYYPNFEGLINELINNYNQDICYITSSIKDPILKNENSKIKVFYINKLLPFFMAYVKCKVFIMTLADLNQFYLKRSIHPVHYVYVFHALVSTNMMYRYGAFDYYDSILCVGEHQIEEIRKNEKINNLKPKKLIEAGYYRLERIYSAYQKYLKNKKETHKKIILIAPSWGKDNVLESCGECLIDVLLKKDYNVIVRPHPEAVKRAPELLNSFDDKFSANNNFKLERSVAGDESLLKADVLISDCSGVALEYAFGTERPVLSLDVPKKIKNSRYEELGIEPIELSLREKIGVVVSPKELNTIPQVIEKLINEKNKYKEIIYELREKNIYNFNNSSKVEAQYIIDLIKK